MSTSAIADTGERARSSEGREVPYGAKSIVRRVPKSAKVPHDAGAKQRSGANSATCVLALRDGAPLGTSSVPFDSHRDYRKQDEIVATNRLRDERPLPA